MTWEEKELLLKDITARLPYYTELYSNAADDNWAILTPVVISNLMNADKDLVIKPYLRPMSSMTDDEREELSKILNYEFYIDNDFALAAEDDRHRIRLDLFEDYIDWLLARHFDFRGLIGKGLALEAPDDMYKTE